MERLREETTPPVVEQVLHFLSIFPFITDLFVVYTAV